MFCLISIKNNYIMIMLSLFNIQNQILYYMIDSKSSLYFLRINVILVVLLVYSHIHYLTKYNAWFFGRFCVIIMNFV